MEVVLLNVLLALSMPSIGNSRTYKRGDITYIRGGMYEGCIGKIAVKNGDEYGMYLDCQGDKVYDHINKRDFE